MLQNQLARGNNGLMKTKYLTFGIESETLKTAKPRLERIETDILNNFKRLGVSAQPTIEEITKMRTYLEDDEIELAELTVSALRKLERISDEEFDSLDLISDLDD